MKALEIKYNCLTGFSDHTLGITTSIHAASIGACMIEKHVGLKKNNSVDSFFSINDTEFKDMIKIIRQNEISSGKVDFGISKSSIRNLNGRRSLYVTENIKKGEKFTEKNIRSIRPTFGLHPKFFRYFLNRNSNKELKKGTRLSWKYIQKNS
jgi:pseudaminic acid synthase